MMIESVATQSLNRSHLLLRRVTIAAIIVFLLFGSSAAVYGLPRTSKLVRILTSVFPFPAAVVNGQIITVRDELREFDALSRAQKQQQAADTSELAPLRMEAIVVDTLVGKILIRQLARAYDVKSDSAQVEKLYAQIVAEKGDEQAFEIELQETFGWTPEEFRARVVVPFVLSSLLNDKVVNDETSQETRRQVITVARTRVATGEAMSDVARDLSLTYEVNTTSDLGFLSASELPDAWQVPAFELAIGDVSEILESPEGFAVIQILDRVTNEEETRAHIVAIRIPRKGFSDLFDEAKASAKIWKLIGRGGE